MKSYIKENLIEFIEMKFHLPWSKGEYPTSLKHVQTWPWDVTKIDIISIIIEDAKNIFVASLSSLF